MLARKISAYIADHLQGDSDKILLIEGARQVGKSFIIRNVGTNLFQHFVEINLVEDAQGPQIFKDVQRTEAFYLRLSMVAGSGLDRYDNTLVFIDEIQVYPQFLTLLKFLRQEHRYKFIASGSLLGVTLLNTTSLPMGSVVHIEMFPLDFEEFLMANQVGTEVIGHMRDCFLRHEALDLPLHNHIFNLFKRYLLVGGMPDAVNAYLATHNIAKVREVHQDIHSMYGMDAARYEQEAGKKLLIRRIYEMIPSQMENKKKRMVAKEIRGKEGDRFAQFVEEFEYLLSSGIAVGVHAVSNPKYPLAESAHKNLIKMYLNDVGLLTWALYGNNVLPVLDGQEGVSLGGVYESVVAQELRAHHKKLFYYDNKQKGEVDFLVDDPLHVGVLPIEVKSGKDYSRHSALDKLMSVPEYRIPSSVVLSNVSAPQQKGAVWYLPVYSVMFMDDTGAPQPGVEL